MGDTSEGVADTLYPAKKIYKKRDYIKQCYGSESVSCSGFDPDSMRSLDQYPDPAPDPGGQK
jgi:hypothetical protein